MTKLEIERLLKMAGFIQYIGGKHDIWKKIGYPPIPVPRHRGDIPTGTAKNILRSAGIKMVKK